MTHEQNSKKNIFLLGDKTIAGALSLDLLGITFIPQNIDLKKYDALIFTSKTAVLGIDKSNPLWKTKPSYTIGEKTAKLVLALGGNLKFTGTKKTGDGFANELAKELKNKKALYVRGEVVVSNLLPILHSNNILCDDIIIYKTTCKKGKEKGSLPKNSIIIFSSPSTIKCFLENYFWDDSFKAVTIGETTTKYIPPYITPILSDDTSLEACVKKAMEII